MLLLSKDPEIAKDEAALRQWYTDVMGAEDADDLIRYFWTKYNDKFVDMMAAVHEQCQLTGLQLLKNLLVQARKPREVREAEEQILAYAAPRLHAAIEKVRAQGGDEEYANGVLTDFLWMLEEELYRMFPDKHRATMKGALMSGVSRTAGKLTLNVAAIVETLFLQDPLAASAAASR